MKLNNRIKIYEIVSILYDEKIFTTYIEINNNMEMCNNMEIIVKKKQKMN